MDVCFVLFLFCLSTCVCVCLQVRGPLQKCPRAGRFRASLLLHTTCVRSWCNWRASCVASKQQQKKHKKHNNYSNTLGRRAAKGHSPDAAARCPVTITAWGNCHPNFFLIQVKVTTWQLRANYATACPGGTNGQNTLPDRPTTRL